ncbi:hypothetical protein SNEBB_010605 [Seison nebaliae]|nr:hypothetical protein SNEBB_010605 [Seison nebaliae]
MLPIDYEKKYGKPLKYKTVSFIFNKIGIIIFVLILIIISASIISVELKTGDNEENSDDNSNVLNLTLSERHFPFNCTNAIMSVNTTNNNQIATTNVMSIKESTSIKVSSQILQTKTTTISQILKFPTIVAPTQTSKKTTSTPSTNLLITVSPVFSRTTNIRDGTDEGDRLTTGNENDNDDKTNTNVVLSGTSNNDDRVTDQIEADHDGEDVVNSNNEIQTTLSNQNNDNEDIGNEEIIDYLDEVADNEEDENDEQNEQSENYENGEQDENEEQEEYYGYVEYGNKNNEECEENESIQFHHPHGDINEFLENFQGLIEHHSLKKKLHNDDDSKHIKNHKSKKKW